MTTKVRQIDPFVWILIAASFVVVVFVRIAGVPFSADQLSAHPTIPTWQLLDLDLLRHHLLSSIDHLEMQPPLYNFGIGLLLDLPNQVQSPAAELTQFFFYVVTALATYGTLRELRCRRRIALAVTLIFVVLDPAQFLYSATTFYVTPTAALATCLAYSIVRLIKHPSRSRALVFGATGAALALLNTSIQPLLIFLLLALIVLFTPTACRTIIRGALIPMSILLLWMVHTLAAFGTPATSTWFGMNLAHTTMNAAPEYQIQRLIRTHHLSPLAAIPPFSPISAYGHVTSMHGNSALTQITKHDGSPNFNNKAYASISSRYLQDDLRYIHAEPYQYITNVARGVSIWLVPADQYFTLSSDLGWYRAAYDTYVQWQPRNDSNAAYLAVYYHQYPTISQISYLQLAIDILVLIGVPILIVSWWKRRNPLARALAVLGVLFLQSFVIMNLTDIAENNRFRFEAGSVPLILATTVVLAALGRLEPDEESQHVDSVTSPALKEDTVSRSEADAIPSDLSGS